MGHLKQLNSLIRWMQKLKELSVIDKNQFNGASYKACSNKKIYGSFTVLTIEMRSPLLTHMPLPDQYSNTRSI